MEKNKIYFWILIVFFSFSYTQTYSLEKIDLIGKNKEVSYLKLKKIIPDLNIILDKVTLVGKIVYKNKTISFLIGSKFYVCNGLIEKTNGSIRYSQNDFYISQEFIEAIFVNLISENIEYNFTENHLEIKIQKNNPKAKTKLVIIDPGHGGKDPGAISVHNLLEKNITLAMGIILKKELQSSTNYEIHLTRSNDDFIPLLQRSNLANEKMKKNSDTIFISLHCNSSISSKANGFEIYYLSPTPTSENSRNLAIIENKIIGYSKNPTIQTIQAKMFSSSTQRRSRLLAKNIMNGIDKELNDVIINRGMKKADFSVLRESLIPAILIEIGYLSNNLEESNLKNRKVLIKISKGITNGIIEFDKATD